jgi:HD-like signal output (HDOD) protein
MNTSARKLVEEIDSLVSLPDVCIKVNRLLDSPDYSALRLGEIIAQDTDLSARLLRLVNSSFFGLRVPVDTISRAIALIGTKELRNLVMATTAVRVFTGIPADLVDMAEFWRHALTTGVIAQELAVRCNVLHSERLFVMGMLHDIGRLVIYLTLPEPARDILLITGGDDRLLPDAEADVLGFTHMDVGQLLLSSWGLPESLVAVIGSHHYPQKTDDHQFDASLVHIAIAMSYGEINGLSIDEIMGGIHVSVWPLTGLDLEAIESILAEIPSKAAEAMELIVSPSEHKHTSSGNRPD